MTSDAMTSDMKAAEAKAEGSRRSGPANRFGINRFGLNRFGLNHPRRAGSAGAGRSERADRSNPASVLPFRGHLLVALTQLGALLAAVVTATSWEAYTPHPPVIGALLITSVAAPLAIYRITRAKAMTMVTLLALSAAVFAVDLAVPLTLEPGARLGPAAWNWGAGAVVICVVSTYRRARDVVLVAGTHAGIGVAFALAAGAPSPAATVVMVTTCLVPPLAASNYLSIYTDGMRARQVAVNLRTRTTALRAAEQAQRQSVLDSVESIRNKIILLLEAVGGAEDVSGDAVRVQARDLSAALRRGLDESRSRGWLFTSPTTSDGGAPGPAVDVLGPANLLDDDGRASVAALVELLHRHQGLRQIVVTISAADHASDHAARPRPVRRAAVGERRPPVEVTVVASGPACADAAADPAIQAAADGLNGTLWQDPDAGNLVVEALVRGVVRDVPLRRSAVNGGPPMPD